MVSSAIRGSEIIYDKSWLSSLPAPEMKSAEQSLTIALDRGVPVIELNPTSENKSSTLLMIARTLGADFQQPITTPPPPNNVNFVQALGVKLFSVRYSFAGFRPIDADYFQVTEPQILLYSRDTLQRLDAHLQSWGKTVLSDQPPTPYNIPSSPDLSRSLMDGLLSIFGLKNSCMGIISSANDNACPQNGASETFIKQDGYNWDLCGVKDLSGMTGLGYINVGDVLYSVSGISGSGYDFFDWRMHTEEVPGVLASPVGCSSGSYGYSLKEDVNATPNSGILIDCYGPPTTQGQGSTSVQVQLGADTGDAGVTGSAGLQYSYQIADAAVGEVTNQDPSVNYFELDTSLNSAGNTGKYTYDSYPGMAFQIPTSGHIDLTQILNGASWATLYCVLGSCWCCMQNSQLYELYWSGDAAGPMYHLTMNKGTDVSVSPSSEYGLPGAQIQISAYNNCPPGANGWEFTGWTGTGPGSYTGSNNPAIVTMYGDISETASAVHLTHCPSFPG
jgi:hypothetical protein